VRGLRGAVIDLWVDDRSGRPRVTSVMQALFAELHASGAVTRVRVPEHEVAAAEGREAADLVLLQSSGPLGLARARAGEVHGLRCLNGAAVTVRALDRAAVIGRLAAAGVPLPATFLLPASSASGAIRAGHARQGWVVKPVFGAGGNGIGFGDSPARAIAAARGVGEEPLLLQNEIGEGPDLKVCVAGEALFAGWKRWDPGSYLRSEVEPTALGTHEQAIVRRVGAALELRCYGVTLRLEADGSPRVVDAKPFPGYRGFPEAVGSLLGEVEEALRGRSRLEHEVVQ
jgi:glutathione synthase/RimK-type ligase-like ATP-grasp enzyme